MEIFIVSLPPPLHSCQVSHFNHGVSMANSKLLALFNTEWSPIMYLPTCLWSVKTIGFKCGKAVLKLTPEHNFGIINSPDVLKYKIILSDRVVDRKHSTQISVINGSFH